MFIKKNVILFALTLTICFANTFDEKPCYIQPLVDIANKTLYFATNFKGNYFDAVNFCRTHCMHLVSIENEAEQEGIKLYLEKTPYNNEFFWTSGNDLAKEGEFKWMATGQRVSYTNWEAGEPNNKITDGASEDCLAMVYQCKWNDFNCKFQFYFVCEVRQ